jgi:hypothetical protein
MANFYQLIDLFEGGFQELGGLAEELGMPIEDVLEWMKQHPGEVTESLGDEGLLHHGRFKESIQSSYQPVKKRKAVKWRGKKFLKVPSYGQSLRVGRRGRVRRSKHRPVRVYHERKKNKSFYY